MRTAALPDALLAATLGLALSYAPPKVARMAAAAAAVMALGFAAVPCPGVSPDFAFTACWLSVVLCGAAVHLPAQPAWLSWGLALNSGFWAGLLSHVQGGAPAVAVALPLLLLVIPGQLIVRRGWGVAVKVACSWMIAIAALEIGLLFVPTPGYAPDHMD